METYVILIYIIFKTFSHSIHTLARMTVDFTCQVMFRNKANRVKTGFLTHR